MKIGRNDPCPCGSGKKYKKCCLAKDTAARSEAAAVAAKAAEAAAEAAAAEEAEAAENVEGADKGAAGAATAIKERPAARPGVRAAAGATKPTLRRRKV